MTSLAFVCLFFLFQDHPEFSRLKGLCQFLQFVPLPDEVLDFFKPVAGQIIQLLKGKSFLPTINSGTTDTCRLCRLKHRPVHNSVSSPVNVPFHASFARW